MNFHCCHNSQVTGCFKLTGEDLPFPKNNLTSTCFVVIVVVYKKNLCYPKCFR